ncbi:hypothetical protein M422DRAFT_62342 [Sphaerobolus stellatus SS14]|uniref:Zn(2)-C6 fungal-type domain-containing protein n=1 Tax=Sphaerobolus stellatus (strain SS14) TaxID=990650 RepID=A0A0C9TRD3_SPHS4|nr:hypothetical protein M422DRAFT_62342 [Sphaerobolus stellatus SS14]
MYPPYYPQYGDSSRQQASSHLGLSNMQSPSDDSDSAGSPAPESNSNGKRPAGSGGGSSKKYKKDDDAASQSPGLDKDTAPKAKPTRGSRACTVCRRLKMKCVGAENGPPCKRCQASNNDCIFEESNRGKRSSKKHELLTRSLRKMERTLDTVLRSISNPGMSAFASGMVSRSPSPSVQSHQTQALLNSPTPPLTTIESSRGFLAPSPKLHSLPDNSLNPLGLLAEASLSNRRLSGGYGTPGSGSQDEAKKNTIGVASDTYFKPGPMTILPLRRLYIERQIQPEMLSFTSTQEVVDLFNIYFEHMHPHCVLLQREFHTPSLVCSRSPFLLTAICAIASKHYTHKPELHPRLSNLARSLAFSVPEKGYKSVEIVQAYLLMTLWGCGPVERYEQDKTWIMLGMAIRMATDLNLHRKTTIHPPNTDEERARAREIFNRERTWLLCYGLDRSFSAQMGKPHSIKEDFIIRNASTWWRNPMSPPTDASLASYVELQRILSRSLDFLYSGTSSPSGLQIDCDYLLVTKSIETQIRAWSHEWSHHPAATTQSNIMRQFYCNYALLVVNSFGLQNALERSPVDIGHFFARCHGAATTVATVVRDELGPSGFLRYCTDSNFVQTSYAIVSLIKFFRPEFRPFLESEQKTIKLIKEVADLLESIASNSLDTPALYSTFLKALIAAKFEGTTTLSSPKSNSVGLNGAAQPQAQPMFHGALPDQMTDQNKHSNAFNSNPQLFDPMNFTGEMGPVADMSTFPPRMAPQHTEENPTQLLSMDNIFNNDFWDNVLVPGYSNTLEGLSGGFVYGQGGNSMYIASRLTTPIVSRVNSPMMNNRPELTHPLTG